MERGFDQHRDGAKKVLDTILGRQRHHQAPDAKARHDARDIDPDGRQKHEQREDEQERPGEATEHRHDELLAATALGFVPA